MADNICLFPGTLPLNLEENLDTSQPRVKEWNGALGCSADEALTLLSSQPAPLIQQTVRGINILFSFQSSPL